jgi:hypothetical protein
MINEVISVILYCSVEQLLAILYWPKLHFLPSATYIECACMCLITHILLFSVKLMKRAMGIMYVRDWGRLKTKWS